MRIVIANAKGGVGKTTTAVMLAQAAHVRGGLSPLVLDSDPQASATLWAQLADQSGEHLPFDVEAANLVTLGSDRSGAFEIVDCPPSGRTFDKAVSSADFVVVPSSESSTDLQQSWATLEAVPERVPAAILLCRCEERTRAYKEAVNALRTLKTPRFDTVIPKSQALKNVFGHVPEKLYGYGDVLSELLEALGAAR